MNWVCRCGKEIRGGKAEHCSVCHQTFTGTSAGDAHRVGSHGVDRRCLTPDEMRSHPKRPMEQDRRGYWRFPTPAAKAKWWEAS